MDLLNNQTLWISHSAIIDFENCPRGYYFKHLYYNPASGNKIRVVNPYLTLGTVVHKTLQDLNILPADERFKNSLAGIFEKDWQDYQGKKGGFVSARSELSFKERGKVMLTMVEGNPEVLTRPSYALESLLKLRLFKNDNIVLVGSVDWVERLPSGEAHIIDFKTGRNEESSGSLQLPIYVLLAKYNLKKTVNKVSYWYLNHESSPREVVLGDFNDYVPLIREKAKNIQRAIQENELDICRSDSRCDCWKYEKAAQGGAEYVGFDPLMQRDLFYI